MLGRATGTKLFFVSAPRRILDAEMMEVPVRTDGSAFSFGAAAALFKLSMLPTSLPRRDDDLSLDGKRFLVGIATIDPERLRPLSSSTGPQH